MGRSSRHLYSILLILLCIFILYLMYRNTNIIRGSEGFQEKKEFHFYNTSHYGDSILNLKFFYNISEKMKENNIMIHYYYGEWIKNVSELERYTDSASMTLHPYSEHPESAIELWMKNPVNGISGGDFANYYNAFYANILKIIGLEDKGIDTSLYQKEDYLLTIYEGLDDKYKDIDILIINAEPKSGQFEYNKNDFDTIIKKLSEKYRVVTTSPSSSEIPCTMNDKLALQDIGAISTHAKYIFAIHSGPLIPCFNLHTKQYVKKWIIMDRGYYNFGDIPHVLRNTLPDINTILSEFNVE
jgi:hypothetical protein